MSKKATALKICSFSVLMFSIAVATAGNMVKDGSGNTVMYKGMEKKAMMDDKMAKDKMMDHKMDKMEKKEMMDDKMEKKPMMDKMKK